MGGLGSVTGCDTEQGQQAVRLPGQSTLLCSDIYQSPNSLQCSVQKGRNHCLLQSAKPEPLRPAQSPSIFSSLSPVLWGEALDSVCTPLVALWICNTGRASHTGVTGWHAASCARALSPQPSPVRGTYRFRLRSKKPRVIPHPPENTGKEACMSVSTEQLFALL